jgi:hypothetical protein
MKKKLAHNQYGTGALPNKTDLRDKKWSLLARAVTPFDWTKGYDVEVELANKLNKPGFKIPVKDQNGSYSCVGQACAYYESVQDAIEKGIYTEKSARDAYSQIFAPGGGSSTRAGVNLIVKKGVCRESLMPSYLVGGYPPDEAFITKRKDARKETISDALTAKGSAYASVKIDIDSMAQAIRDNHGIIFVVEGEDNGTWRTKFPRPPIAESEWAHCIYAGKAKLINGKKHIGILNSWSENTGDNGWQWLNEEYINKTFSRDAMTVYDTENDVLIQKIAWYEQILELLQKLFLSKNTK